MTDTGATGAIASYVMATCHPRTELVFAADGTVRPDLLRANIEEYCRLIERAAGDHGARLIAFPQFGLTGYAPVSSDRWVAAGLAFPGPELERIGHAARAAGAYVVVQAAERHTAFPGRYFLSAAILTPQGDVGLVYRKHYTLSLRTSPIDVHDAFVATFGADAFFPVLGTPIGCIGLTIGAEVHWPEVTRSLALNGAEVIVNPVAAAASIDYLNRAGATAVRGVRAFENMAYLGMANIGTLATAPPSEIHDYTGLAIGRAVGDTDRFTLATVDIGALRTLRASAGSNLLAQIQPAVHEDLHRFPLWPENAFPHHAAATFDELGAVEAAAWRRLRQAR